LAGTYPATVLSRFQPISALKGEAHIGGRNRLTRTLIVLQYTIAITLIICTGVLIQQQQFMSHKNLGYDQANVLTVGVKNRQQADLYKQELLKDSDVSHVSITDRAFVSGNAALTCKMPDGSKIDVRTIAIDPDFLPTLNISLLQGRNFSAKHSTDREQAILINKSLAQKLNLNDPIGHVFSGFKLGNITPTIVGIVDDFHIDALHNPIQPLVLQMDVFLTNPKLLIRIQPNHLPETIALLEKVMQKAVSGDPIKLTFLNERLQQQYLVEKHWQKILTYSAIFTVLISCLGLLGLATLTASRRTKEIGIRKVLGASVPNLVSLLSIDFIKLLLIANIIA
jgi:putative ABC transport system permease protein